MSYRGVSTYNGVSMLLSPKCISDGSIACINHLWKHCLLIVVPILEEVVDPEQEEKDNGMVEEEDGMGEYYYAHGSHEKQNGEAPGLKSYIYYKDTCTLNIVGTLAHIAEEEAERWSRSKKRRTLSAVKEEVVKEARNEE